ncbi:10860_t:CDS:1 [Paraglomus occultum]|uniref:10860_t:CDS:1 n=1 Tax=Paraglomus occultum TaxID=144539 RepID=A0A9N9AYR2_9GLOM|nr:10860_t:CDS:1 [Paraglomus occultum]
MTKLEKSKIEHLIREISKVITESELDKDSNYYESLLSMIENLTLMKEELEKSDNKVTRVDEQIQDYTIFEAAEENEAEIIQKLVESGADVDSIDEQGNTALHYSVMKGNLEATKKLLELGIEANVKNEDGETPLHIAAKLDDEYEEDVILKISTALLEKGVSPTAQDELGNTALHYAVQRGNLSLLKTLVKKKEYINVTNNFNWSVLHSAASAIVEGIENWEIIEWLIKNGADVTVKSTMGSSVYDIFRKKDQAYAERYKNIIEIPAIKK